MATEGSGGSEKPATAATPTAPDSSSLSLPQQSPAPQEHAPTRSTPVQVLEDAMSGSSSESAPRVPASDVRLQGAADTVPIEEGEGTQPTLPTETSPASGSTSSTLSLAGSSQAPQGQSTSTARSEDAIGGRSIESAPPVPASHVPLQGPGLIFQAPRVSDGVLRGGGFVFRAPRVPAPDLPARASQLFVPGGDNIDDTDIARIRTLIDKMTAEIAASASDSETPLASDSTTLALSQSSPAQRDHGTTSSPPVHVPADTISDRSVSGFLPGPWDALFCPPPASLQPRRNVGVIGGGRPARATAGDPEMRLMPFRGHAPHAGMALLRQPEPEVSTMVVRMAPLGSAGSLQWRQHAPHVGGAPFVQLEPGFTRMMGVGMEWTTGQPWRQHVGHGPPGAQMQLHHEQPPLRLEHGRHHLAPTRHNNYANSVLISRDDVQRGWDELQARRQESVELRRHNHLLQKECWNLRQALRLRQTPSSNGVCGDCSGPAQVQLTPCLHYGLCIDCYEKRHECPCCRQGFD